ncbi:MAG: hypothetical protein AB7N71_14865 [Phycisphaerae bacterium]
MRQFKGARLGLCLAALTVPCAALGDGMGISDPALVVQASNASGTGSFSVGVDQLTETAPGQYSFVQLTPIQIEDTQSGDFVATLTNATLFLVPDPQIGIGFAVQAGSSDTVFTITSALLSFPALMNQTGEASAALTLTDVGGNGALLTGNGPSGNSYAAQYNGVVPGGTTFASGISMLSSGGSTAGAINVLPTLIAGSVTDMSAQFSFTLSANDLASGTSNYSITPEPATLSLLALGFLALRRR